MTVLTHIFAFFRTYLVNERGLAANTLASYAEAIKQLFVFAADKLGCHVHKLDMATLRDDIVREFLDRVEAKNSIVTRNQRLCAIRLFFRYLARQHPEMMAAADSICHITKKKEPQKTMPSLTETELDAFFAVAGDQSNDLRRARDVALVHFLYNTGARASETVGVDITDLVPDKTLVVTLNGKGGTTRALPLWEETADAINAYLKLRTELHIEHEALFLNNQCQRLGRFGLRDIVKRLARRAAHITPSLCNKRVTPHTFRHTTAFHILRATNNLVTVKDWLGHKDINTTSCYCTVDPETKRRAFATFRAAGEKGPTPDWKKPDAIDLLRELARSA